MLKSKDIEIQSQEHDFTFRLVEPNFNTNAITSCTINLLKNEDPNIDDIRKAVEIINDTHEWWTKLGDYEKLVLLKIRKALHHYLHLHIRLPLPSDWHYLI